MSVNSEAVRLAFCLSMHVIPFVLLPFSLPSDHVSRGSWSDKKSVHVKHPVIVCKIKPCI